MMILMLLAAASVPAGHPPSCLAAERAIHEMGATVQARYVGSPPDFGPVGDKYREVKDRLAIAMRADIPDMAEIEKLWLELDRLKLELNARFLTTQSQCTIDRLKMLPVAERKKMLQTIAPRTTEELGRARSGLLPVAPPAPGPR